MIYPFIIYFQIYVYNVFKKNVCITQTFINFIPTIYYSTNTYVNIFCMQFSILIFESLVETQTRYLIFFFVPSSKCWSSDSYSFEISCASNIIVSGRISCISFRNDKGIVPVITVVGMDNLILENYCYAIWLFRLLFFQGIQNQQLNRYYRYDEELVVPIIENTCFECDLEESMAAVLEKYPQTTAVLVRRHGLYVWGDTWQQAKTQ